MNKQELIDQIWEHARNGRGDSDQHMCAGITKKEVGSVLYYLGKIVVERELLQGGKVNLPGLGQFSARWVEDKTRREMRLVAHFDYSNEVEAAVLAARRQH